MNTKKKPVNVRYMTMTAMLSAIAFVLMMLEFSIPIMPSFIKLDFSELPALIGSFAMGPLSGTVICLIKNLLHLPMSSTGGVGELSNFILGAMFVIPAGLFYKKRKGRKSALIGSLVGAVLMSVVSVASNYFIVYPGIHRVYADGGDHQCISGNTATGRHTLKVSGNFQYAVYLCKRNDERADYIFSL